MMVAQKNLPCLTDSSGKANNEQGRKPLSFVHLLGGQNFTRTVLNLNEVHAFGKVCHVIRIAFDKLKFLDFPACQTENHNEAHLIGMIIYGNVVGYRIGINRKIGPIMILSL